MNLKRIIELGLLFFMGFILMSLAMAGLYFVIFMLLG